MNLKATGLACGYGKGPVVQDIELELGRGELVALIGPNGAGKSTLLRTLTGYLKSMRGTITLDGQNIRDIGPEIRAKRLSYVPQAEPPVFDFTVAEVVLMGRTPYGDESSCDHKRDQALEQMGLSLLRDRPVTELSGGEYQRTLLARALVQEALLMLLDEPTAHLDLGHQAGVMSLLRSLVSQGIGVLCVLQDLNLASDFCDRVLLLGPGQGLISGTPAETLSEKRLRSLYGDAVVVTTNPFSGRPAVFVRSL